MTWFSAMFLSKDFLCNSQIIFLSALSLLSQAIKWKHFLVFSLLAAGPPDKVEVATQNVNDNSECGRPLKLKLAFGDPMMHL